jgi:hypothetical protein
MTKHLNKLEQIEAQERALEFAKKKEAESEAERLQKLAEADYALVGFDLDDMSWDDANEFADLMTREFVASEDDDRDALNEARHQIRRFLSRVVTEVPDDWFVSSLNGDAKEFDNPELYRFLKATRIQRLMAALNYALESAQKN